MKTFGTRIVAWMVALLIGGLVSQSQTPLEADPVSDFSFALQYAPMTGRYGQVTVDRIALIFERHLDPRPTPIEARRLALHLIQVCRRYRFDPAFILSMVQVESSFRARVVSSAGAVGLMQLMPATARLVARQERLPYRGTSDLNQPTTNLTLGVAYLAYLRERYAHLPPYFHIAAYNLGPYKLDQLRSRKGFKPVKTRQYYERIKKGVPTWRYYPLDRKSISS